MICIAGFIAIFVAGWAIYFESTAIDLIFLFLVASGSGYGEVMITRPTVIAGLLGRRYFSIGAGLLAIGFFRTP